MKDFKKLFGFTVGIQIILLSSCSTIESTVDSTWDSITEAGDYIYDSVNFWEEEEPDQSEAIIIEEAVEVPEYAIPDQEFIVPQSVPQNMVQQSSPLPYYDPVYRSARQYYFVGPNGTPLLAPPPPPFPQYSIDQVNPTVPYSYNNNLPIINQNQTLVPAQQKQPTSKPVQRMLSEEEEMELFGIQNNCVRVAKDYVNGGYVCDDFD